MVQIAVNIGLGFIPADADVLCQGELTDAVDNTEIDCLGMTTLQRRYLRSGDPKNLGGSGGVNVAAALKCLLHGFVIGNVGQHPQLNLAVVCVHQNKPGFWNKHFPDLRAQGGPNRNIL